mmetsp:Transcript_33052/g.52968  ORF Transcript_33052/g.52968 Transcript_33052/m.52968 type:complete len:229 (-) Transcript_33052:69-755(-)
MTTAVAPLCLSQAPPPAAVASRHRPRQQIEQRNNLANTTRQRYRSRGARAAAAASVDGTPPGRAPRPEKGKLLVLGGTGFVGSNICVRAIEAGFRVVSVSRRGLPPDGIEQGSLLSKVEWRAGDLLAAPGTVRDILAEGGYVGCIHAVGMLLTSDLNALASGSGSMPNAGATYDDVTRVTASTAADATAECVFELPESESNGSGGDSGGGGGDRWLGWTSRVNMGLFG